MPETALDAFFSAYYRRRPVNATFTGVHDFDDRLPDPGRLVGIHFFNPVAQMPLVEIVRGKETSDDSVQKAIAFTRRNENASGSE